MKKLLAFLLVVVFLGLCVFCSCSTSTSDTSQSDSNTLEYELAGGERRTSTYGGSAYAGSVEIAYGTITFTDPVQNDNSFWAVYEINSSIGNLSSEIKGPFMMDDNTITITDNEDGDSVTLGYVYDNGEFIITDESIGLTYEKLY